MKMEHKMRDVWRCIKKGKFSPVESLCREHGPCPYKFMNGKRYMCALYEDIIKEAKDEIKKHNEMKKNG